MSERALVHDVIDATRLARIREDMERAEARRLQPHYVEAFFLEAFRRLGGSVREREPRRYEVTHVPALVRTRDRQIGTGEPVLKRYERIAFEKPLIAHPASPWRPSSVRGIRSSMRSLTSRSSATASSCAGEACSWTSRTRARSRGCFST
ncbi:MAG: hypothetical protein KatS3mg121_1313 [Gammaproteobacteria bacterium]|nr:MAG: hypothetical protein KatS3mg121_1313 [Gammaproteobacteria bacterium]